MKKRNCKRTAKRIILTALALLLTLPLTSCSIVQINFDDILDDVFPFEGTFSDETVDLVGDDTVPDGVEAPDAVKKHEYTGLSEAQAYLAEIGEYSFDGGAVFIKTTATEENIGQLFVDGDVDEEDTYSASVYERNRMVEEALNCELRYVTTTVDKMIIDIESAVVTKDYYADLLAITQSEVAILAKEGCLYNLRSLPFFTMDEEYFNESASVALSAGYYDYGVISAATIHPDGISCVYVNLDMLREKYDGDLESLAKAGEWTWDVMLEASADSKLSCGSIVAGEGGLADIVSASAGVTLVKNKTNKTPTVSFSDTVFDVVDVCQTLVLDRKSLTAGAKGGGLPAFLGSVSTFHIGKLGDMNELAYVSFDWTVLPMPKISAEEKYRAYTAADTLVLSLPVNISNHEGAATLIRAISAASSGYLRDAYVKYHMYHTVRRSSALTLIEMVYETPFFNFEHGLGTISSDIDDCTVGLIGEMARLRDENVEKLFNKRDNKANKALKKYYEPRN